MENTHRLLHHFVQDAARRDPDKQAVICDGGALSYRQLVDSATAEVPDGKTGELQLQAESLMAGYWDNPEANAGSFVDGWFKTGDLGYRDADGFYFFVSRIKEIIVRAGSNVMPAEVENVLDDHSQVQLSGVVGLPDEHLGNIVAAFIVPEPDGEPTPEQLIAFASERLADYKVPELWFFVDRIPKNPTGKIDRHRLHEMVQQQA